MQSSRWVHDSYALDFTLCVYRYAPFGSYNKLIEILPISGEKPESHFYPAFTMMMFSPENGSNYFLLGRDRLALQCGFQVTGRFIDGG